MYTTLHVRSQADKKIVITRPLYIREEFLVQQNHWPLIQIKKTVMQKFKDNNKRAILSEMQMGNEI
jgi:hypothetical protein